jgi:YD repeat-containing protein
VTSKATPEGTLSYSYDTASDVKTIQSSNTGGAGMTYGYDALDRLSTVTDANGATYTTVKGCCRSNGRSSLNSLRLRGLQFVTR